jgi:hypothetical protein
MSLAEQVRTGWDMSCSTFMGISMPGMRPSPCGSGSNPDLVADLGNSFRGPGSELCVFPLRPGVNLTA